MGALPVHHAPEYTNCNILLPHGCSQGQKLLLPDGRRPDTWLPSANMLKAGPEALLWGSSTPQEQERGHPNGPLPASCPNPESTAPPLPHAQRINSPVQIRYNWKQCYSSEATTIISAMTIEKERNRCPKALLCCSKNDKRSPSGRKARLSWPRYRYSLWTWHANNALLAKKHRCGELYLNFTTFT